MAYYALAQETGAIYTLTNSDNGAVAVFNDPTSANYVGMLTEVTGLDSPDVRESAEELAQADGGTHGQFFFGRRPITLTGTIFGHSTIREREIRMDRARRASMALRGDATLSWIPSPSAQTSNPSYLSVFTLVRRSGPFRESGAWNKEFQIPLVSEYAHIYSNTQVTVSGAAGANVTTENRGSWPAYPILRITGPTSVQNPTITQAGGGVIRTTGSLLVASGEILEIDTLNHSAQFIAGARSGQAASSFIDFATTTWPTMQTGNSVFTLNGTTGSLTVIYRHTWV